LSLADILGQRSQSIEINIEKKSPVAAVSTRLGGFSLSDLANEYLATPGSASTAGDLMGEHVSNLVDLIDSEFSSRFSEFDLETEMEKIDFSTENLLIKRKDSADLTSQMSTSLTLRPNLNKSNEEGQPRSFNSYETTEILRKKLSKKRTTSTCSKLENFVFVLGDSGSEDCLQGVYVISGESLFGKFLCHDEDTELGRVNATNCLFEAQFDYSVQRECLKSKSQSEKRRKFVVEVVSRQERRLSKTKTADVDSVRVKKTGGRTPGGSKAKGKGGSNSSGGNKENRATVAMFDFSIPSPDDIVIAKQKFAFRNMRYK